MNGNSPGGTPATPRHPAAKRMQGIAALDKRLVKLIKPLPARERERILLTVIELQLLAQESVS